MTDVFHQQPLHAGGESVHQCTPHALDSMQRVKTQNLVLLQQLFEGLEALQQELKELLQHHTGTDVERDLAPAIPAGPTQNLEDLTQALAEAIQLLGAPGQPYYIQLSKICKEAHEALSNMKQALLDSSRQKDVTNKIETDLTRHLEATNEELHEAQQEMKRLSKEESASIRQKAKPAAIEEMKEEMQEHIAQLVVARSEQQAEIEELKSQVSRLSEELWRERAMSAEELKDREERERAEGSESEADYMIQAVLHQERAEKGNIALSYFERDSGFRLLMMDLEALRTESKMLKKKQRRREQATRILQRLLRGQLACAFRLYLNRVIETRCKRETCRRVLLRMQHQALAGAYDMFFETVEQLKAHRQIVEKVMARWRAPLLMRMLVAWHKYVEEVRDSKERLDEKEEKEKAKKLEEREHRELAQLKEEEWDIKSPQSRPKSGVVV